MSQSYLQLPIAPERKRMFLDYGNLYDELVAAGSTPEALSVVKDALHALRPSRFYYKDYEPGTGDLVHAIFTATREVCGHRATAHQVVTLEAVRKIIHFETQGRVELVSVDDDVYDYYIRFEARPVSEFDRRIWAHMQGRDDVYPSIALPRHVLDEERVGRTPIDEILTRWRVFQSQRAEYARAMFRAQMMAQPEPKKPVRSGGNITQYIERTLSNNVRYDGESPIQLMEVLPTGTLSSRNWGIEIEAVDIAGIDTPPGWDLGSDGSLESVTTHPDPEDIMDHEAWCDALVEDADGELMGYSCDCYRSTEYETETGEWRSPILHSFHSRGLRHLTEELCTREVNETPGIHVHVAADDLAPHDAARVALMYTLFEPLFERDYYRETRSYCSELSAYDLVSIFQRSRQVRELSEMWYERYTTVNLQALGDHGTIEFRAMGPRYDYNFLIRWAAFCREIVNVAKANPPYREWANVKTSRGVIELFAKYGKETPTPKWLRAEGEVLTLNLTKSAKELDGPIRYVRDGFLIQMDDYNGGGLHHHFVPLEDPVEEQQLVLA